jgi:hypothetical protein
MGVLFEYAAKGCVGGIEDQLCPSAPTINVMEGVAWRTIVHSLNILRLIILDATLAPDLHPYIPQVYLTLIRLLLWAHSLTHGIGNKNCCSWIPKPSLGNQKLFDDGLLGNCPEDYRQ